MKKILVFIMISLVSGILAYNDSDFIREQAEAAAEKISSKIKHDTVIALKIDDNTDNRLFTASLTENLLSKTNIRVTDIDNRKELFREAVKQHGRFQEENKNEIRFRNPELMVIGSVEYSIRSRMFKKKQILNLNLNIDEIHTNVTLYKIAETYYKKKPIPVMLLITALFLLTVILIIINSMTKGYFSKILTVLYILFVITAASWYFLI